MGKQPHLSSGSGNLLDSRSDQFGDQYSSDVCWLDLHAGTFQLHGIVVAGSHALSPPDHLFNSHNCRLRYRSAQRPPSLLSGHQHPVGSLCWSYHYELHCSWPCRGICRQQPALSITGRRSVFWTGLFIYPRGNSCRKGGLGFRNSHGI